jgi:hypothetical protein
VNTRTAGPRSVTPGAIALRVAIVALTLTTAYIHFTLGGLMFLATAAGYAALAGAMVLPLSFARDLRWLTRLALMGYTAGVIGGWAVMGHPIFFQSIVAKSVEVVLIGLVAVELYQAVGGPVTVAHKLVAFGARLVGAGAAA